MSYTGENRLGSPRQRLTRAIGSPTTQRGASEASASSTKLRKPATHSSEQAVPFGTPPASFHLPYNKTQVGIQGREK
jgi:hypothetical protein